MVIPKVGAASGEVVVLGPELVTASKTASPANPTPPIDETREETDTGGLTGTSDFPPSLVTYNCVGVR